MAEEKGQPVTEVLADLYKTMDPFAEEYAAKLNASCRKGCAHCCYLLATATLPEGMLIAEKLLNSEDWESWIPKLRHAALEHSYKGINKVNYFNKGLPCVFLGEGNLCRVYAERPSACRYHYVVSPPENCSHHAPPSTNTAVLQTQTLEEHVWRLSFRFNEQIGIPGPVCGPIPLIVLYSMEVMARGDSERHSIIKKACEGIPNPLEWSVSYTEELLREDIENVGEKLDLEEAKKRIGF